MKAYIAADIPILKIKAMCNWIQNNCKQPIGSFTRLYKYTKTLLSEEKTVQIQELILVKYLSIIFDATPRKGDCVAMIARRVAFGPVLKQVTCVQTRIHCAVLDGSLNGNTLAVQITFGLLS